MFKLYFLQTVDLFEVFLKNILLELFISENKHIFEYYFLPDYLPRRGTLFVVLNCVSVGKLRRSDLFVNQSIQTNISHYIQFQIFLKTNDILL
jgi:hypothetical protein